MAGKNNLEAKNRKELEGKRLDRQNKEGKKKAKWEGKGYCTLKPDIF